MILHRAAPLALVFAVVSSGALVAQRPRPAAPPPSAAAPGARAAAGLRSAPVSNIRYEVTFDSASAQARQLRVTMTFDAAGGAEPVLLSLPAWTPGAYEMTWFAKWVWNFSAEAGGRPLAWDKTDFDTWRIKTTGPGPVTVRFAYLADSLDNAIAWAQPDFVLFNGTNLFLYPEGRGLDFPATVTIKTQPGWNVATSMKPAGAPRTYAQANFHDLVDMPFFVGRFDYDSMVVNGKTTRLATYPAGALAGPARAEFWDQVGKAIPAMAKVFGETPWDSYTILDIFSPEYGGGSALEHQSSHLGIYNQQMIGNMELPSITAHEIFHAWNVKRLRPADMWPYEYERPLPTPWLWVSEGITDYYSDLALVRAGIVDSTGFFGLTAQKTQTVADAPPTALQDASLSTWVHPTDGSGYLYYPKGSLAGMLLDIMIRDASDNKHSLDTVMRELYQTAYKRNRGFTAADWWGAVSRAAGGRSFAEFDQKYVDGRDPFPFATVLPMAGLRVTADTVGEPRLGIAGAPDSAGRGVRVAALQPGGASERAGLKVGDVIVALGDMSISDPNFGPTFREKYKKAEGQDLPIKVIRGADTVTVTAKIELNKRLEAKIEADPGASPKAARIRHGLLTGATD
jgi:predicted metalloprotease with PDZ domain